MRALALVLLLAGCTQPDCSFIAAHIAGIEADRLAGNLSAEEATSLLNRALVLREGMGCR